MPDLSVEGPRQSQPVKGFVSQVSPVTFQSICCFSDLELEFAATVGNIGLGNVRHDDEGKVVGICLYRN